VDKPQQKEFIAHGSGTLTEMKSFFRGSSISVGESFYFFAKIAVVNRHNAGESQSKDLKTNAPNG
jgi:hypothetical protein